MRARFFPRDGCQRFRFQNVLKSKKYFHSILFTWCFNYMYSVITSKSPVARANIVYNLFSFDQLYIHGGVDVDDSRRRR